MKVELRAFDLLKGYLNIKEFQPIIYLTHFIKVDGFIQKIENPVGDFAKIACKAKFAYCGKHSKNGKYKVFCFQGLET